MTTTLWIILAVVAVLIALITFNYYRMKNAKPVTTSKKIKVLANKNFKTAVRSGITLVDFWAPWCGPCKIIAPTLNEIAESQDEFTVAKVNVDNNQNLAKKLKIRNIPTMLIFKDGRVESRIVGVKTKKAILKEVQTVMES